MYTIFGWVPVLLHGITHLLCSDLAVFRGKKLDLVSRVFNRAGLVHMNVSRGGTEHALPGAERGGDDGEIGLRGSLQEMDGGAGSIQMLPDRFRCLFAPGIQAVSVVSLFIGLLQRLQDHGMGTAVIVIVKTIHGN